MKTYSISSLKTHEFKGDDRSPHPFPGKWPTRIAWIYAGDLGKADYLGRPNTEQVRRFQKLVKNSKVIYLAQACEFDQSHMLYRWEHIAPATPMLHFPLFYLYHLWGSGGTSALGQFLTRNFIQEVGKLRVYSMSRIFMEATWRHYAEAQGIVGFGKPKSKPEPPKVQVTTPTTQQYFTTDMIDNVIFGGWR